MADDQSVGGKAKINVTYKPSTGNIKEETELPLNTLLVADLTGREDETLLEARKTITVNKENLNEVMAGLEPGADISVADKLGGGDELSASLKFPSYDSFTPEGIARQIPELDKLLKMRAALEAVKSPLGGFPKFVREVQALLNDDEKVEKLRAALLRSDDAPEGNADTPETTPESEPNE